MSDQSPGLPAINLGDVSSTAWVGGTVFNPEGRPCPASAGWHWYGAAWRIFQVRPLNWWAVLLLLLGVAWVGSLLPYGELLVSAIMPILMAGFGSCVRSQLQTGGFEVGQVFDGFRHRSSPLLQVGLLYLLVSVLGQGLMSRFSFDNLSGLYVGSVGERQAAIQTLLVGGGVAMWVYAIAMSVVMSAVVFAPFLVYEHNMPPLQAMKASFMVCARNVPATLVAMLSYALWAVLASIPLGLGWLVLLPVFCLAFYVAYRDIFYT